MNSASAAVDEVIAEIAGRNSQARFKALSLTTTLLNNRLKTFLDKRENPENIFDRLFCVIEHELQAHVAKLHTSNQALHKNHRSGFAVPIEILVNTRNIFNDVPKILSKITNSLKEQSVQAQILDIYLIILKSLLTKNSEHKFALVKDTHWIDLLNTLIPMLQGNSNFNPIIECICQAVKLGCANTQLSSELMGVGIFQTITNALIENNKDLDKMEKLLVLAYECCKNLAADNRFDICRFTDDISEGVFRVLQENRKNIRKLVLFKLLDLILILHVPAVDGIHEEDIKYVTSEDKWLDFLISYERILKNELVQTYNYISLDKKEAEVKVCPTIALIAARFCRYYYWNYQFVSPDENSNINSNTSETSQSSQAKRQKTAVQLQAVLYIINPSEKTMENFNWNWMMVFAELIYNFPASLKLDDIHEVLVMLTKCQSQITTKEHQYAFTKSCLVLLQHDDRFKTFGNNIVYDLCEKLWYNIAEQSATSVTTTNKNSIEAHGLLQVLMHYQKCNSSSFIHRIVQMFVTNSTMKCDYTLNTLIVILQSFNLDSVPNGKELTLDILKYICGRSTVELLKKIKVEGKPSYKTIAKLAVMCCLLKTDMLKYLKGVEINENKLLDKLVSAHDQRKYKAKIDNDIHLIFLKCNKKLLIEEQLTSHSEEVKIEKMQLIPTELKCIIDQEIYEALAKCVEPKKRIINEESSPSDIKTYLRYVMERNELFLNLASEFFNFEAYDMEKYTNSFITKKVDYNLQEINRLFAILIQNNSKLDDHDKEAILKLVQALFQDSYHSEISRKVRSCNMIDCLKWIYLQTTKQKNVNTQEERKPRELDSQFVHSASRHEKNVFMAVTTLCEYFNYDGVNTLDLEEIVIETISFDEHDDMDVCAVLQICETFGRQSKVSLALASWIWPFILSLCMHRNSRNFVVERIIDQLGNITKIMKDHESLCDQLITVFGVFFKFCTGNDDEEYRQVNGNLTVRFIKQFEFFHQCFFQLSLSDEEVKDMYDTFVSHIVSSKTLKIRMAAISCLRKILHYDIDLDRPREMEKILNRNLREFYEKLVEVTDLTLGSHEMKQMDNSDDSDMNIVSFMLQLHCSALCASFNNRIYHTISLFKIFHIFGVSNVIIMMLVNKIKTHLNCNRFCSILDDQDLGELVSTWTSYANIESYPYNFNDDDQDIIQGYIANNYTAFLLSAVKSDLQIATNLIEMANEDMTREKCLYSIIPYLLAYLLPIENGIKAEIKVTPAEIYQFLLPDYTKEKLKNFLKEYVINVILNLLANVIENEKVLEVCGIDPDFYKNSETLSCNEFKVCLKDLKRIYDGQQNESILTTLCLTNLKSVEQLFLLLKKRVESTELKERKLLFLSQYYILLEEVLEYMNRPNVKPADSIKPYLIREVCFYFCYLISNQNDGQRLRHTAIRFLFNFLKSILPACVIEVKHQLHRIIPQLVSICLKSNKESQELRPKCLEIIKLLTLRYKEMNDEIVKLDRFPSDKDFEEIRKKQLDIKYANGEYTLVQEIMVFIEGEAVSRHAEGIAALREHIFNKRDEMKELFQEANKFDGDKESTLLHKLIRKLIFYATYNASTNEDRAVEAVKCLGEIGVHNISSIVFNSEVMEEQLTYQNVTDIEQCIKIISNKALDRLETLLLYPNPGVCQAASDTVHEIMSSKCTEEYTPSVYLRPYIAEKRKKTFVMYVNPKLGSTLDTQIFIKEQQTLKYPLFVKEFCCRMIIIVGWRNMESLVQNSLILAELMFPMIFQLILLYNSDDLNAEIVATLNEFFKNVDEKLNFSEQTNEGSIFLNKMIIRQMLKLVDIVRVHCQDMPKSSMNKMLNLNHLHIAKAAKYCEAFFSAIQNCEIWTEKQYYEQEIPFATSIKNTTLQEIMSQSYLAIGNKEGCNLFLNPTTSRLLYLQQNGMQWQALMEASDSNNTSSCMEFLNINGMHQLAYNCDKSMKEIDKSQQFECLWQLSKWDEVVDADTKITNSKGLIDHEAEFEKHHYLSLKRCKNEDELGMKNSILKARQAIFNLISQQIFECSYTLYKFLEMSHRLTQIEDFAVLRFKRQQTTHEELLDKWKFHDELPINYEHYKRVLMQRNGIFSTANIKTGRRTWIPPALQNNLLFIAKQSISYGFPSDAIKAIAKIKTLENLSLETKLQGLIEEAKLCMTTNTEMAKSCLQQVLDEEQIENNFILKSHANRIYGEIEANSHSQDIAFIIKNYFNRAQAYLEQYARHHNRDNMIPKLDNTIDELSQPLSQVPLDNNDSNVEDKIRDASGIYGTIAKYYDRQYEDRVAYLKSEAYSTKVKSFNNNKDREEKLHVKARNRDITIDQRRAYQVLLKSNQLDKNEIDHAEKERKLAARHAVYFYIRSTINSPDESVFNIFRIVSLMLVNSNGKYVRSIVKENLSRIPSYKFIAALPQLTVRLSNKNDDLNGIITDILETCAKDHPHHTLPLILALYNSYLDIQLDSKNKEKINEEPRVIGAKNLWQKLFKSPILSPIMTELKNMSKGLVHLANMEVEHNIPAKHPVLNLIKLVNVQCPTMELPIDQSGNYSQITSIVKWDSKISNVGGINAPKKISILCSDGVKRPQLLKGKDDLRQDAIFQQIFTVVNKLLCFDEEMHKKRARIRTYKIVPLSRRSGILEWCSDTMPVGNYLCGWRENGVNVKGAHDKYRPNDWSLNKCMQKISNVATRDSDIKLSIFNEIFENTKPVFHQFFNENYKSPGSHFEHRLAYTISVAVSSMIGYILGIGDRHVQNILIDIKTAELIHIDFGVAFEQGKCLPHPEFIPFRLSRDIIAPMGVSGVDGIFRKSCEQALDILCRNERTITTILEVLLYDPMHTWTVGAEVARKVQLSKDDDEAGNDGKDQVDEPNVSLSLTSEERQKQEKEHDSMAKRALLRCQSKLKGISESNNVTYPTIEGHVQHLIQSATNPVFLSRLFKGWQAYL